MKHTLYQQQQEQKRWILHPHARHLKVFDQLLHNEFCDSKQQIAQYTQRVFQFIHYAIHAVPYYRDRQSSYTLNSKCFSLDHLTGLPRLEKHEVQTHYTSMNTQALPSGFKIAGAIKSSGTTGEPVKVLYTENSLQAFAFYKQREYRSWGLNPGKSFLSLRPPSDLPLLKGQRLKKGQALKLSAWRYLGGYFNTGSELYLSDRTPIDLIVEFVETQKPDYLLTMAGTLEHMALAYSGLGHRSSMAGVLSISQQLTDSMRGLAEKHVSANIYQNYGLNEVGLVAMRCPHSNHYHVHNENVVIEIINQQGQPCQPGEQGKLLVTNVSNPAMPLIRYDTDDFATVPESPCPCGRTQQSFIKLRGRYRRTAHLPEGTWEFWDNIVNVFSDAHPEDMHPIKQYQLHQLTADHYHLKLKTTEPVADRLKQQIYRAYKTVYGQRSINLQIKPMAAIDSPGKKFQNFVSDVVPAE